MKAQALPAIVVAIAFAGLIVVFQLFGANLLSAPDVLSPDANFALANRVSLSIQTMEQVENFLVTVTFGLVVLVGFALRPTEAGRMELTISDVVAATFFTTITGLSLFFAYGARLRLFEVVSAGSTDLDSLRPIITTQALSTAVASVPAFYLTARALYATRS